MRGKHEVCKDRLQQFRDDLNRAPDKEKWKIFRAAELGYYGSVEITARPYGRIKS